MTALATVMLVTPTWAGGLDLPKIQEKYGLPAVYTVVHAMSMEDRSSSSIYDSLHKGGLHRIEMPVHLDEGAKARIQRPSSLTGCTWSWGVYCQFTAVAVKPMRTLGWQVTCVDEDRAQITLEDPLKMRIEAPTITGETATIQISDLSACWREGGAGVHVVSQ